MSSADPGGGSPDLTNLQESFSQQQAKISALKELVRKSEATQGKNTASAQEKVRNIAQRLTHLKSKANRSRQSAEKNQSEEVETILEYEASTSNLSLQLDQMDISSTSTPIPRARSETPGSEKIQLLRKQMEQNRLKMAERENSKRGIEELVTQLKAKFDTTQLSLEKSAELGRSMGDLSLLGHHSEFTTSPHSHNFDKERIRTLERKIRELEEELNNKENIPEAKRIKELENRVLDLEENLREKECIIEARTQAVTLMSENLSLKGKNTVDLLEDTKQEMLKMQTNFVQAENNLKDEIEHLKAEIIEKGNKIANLEEMNNILETTRFDLTIKNAGLENKIEDVQEYTTKLNELNKMNQSLQHRINDLENQKYEFFTDEEVAQAKIGNFEDSSQYKELCAKIETLQNENDIIKRDLLNTQEKEEIEEETNNQAQSDKDFTDCDLRNKVLSLEQTISGQNEQILAYESKITLLEESLSEKTVECNVLNANFSVLQEKLKLSAPKSLFSKSTDEEAELEITKLKNQLDEANKSQIKAKLKIKQLQKQIDSFKKTSNVHQDVVRLTEENQGLLQRIVELEEEKGNLQLRLLNNEGSGLTESEMEKKLKVLETTCQNQTSAIQLLEEQKMDINENLQLTKKELVALKDQINEIDSQETVRVTTHMDSIEMEEKIEQFSADKEALTQQVEILIQINEELKAEIGKINEEKKDLLVRLDNYTAENMELLEKLDKLSIEKASSAESIEIVENLTQQEKLEMERLENEQKDDQVDGESSNEMMGQELSDSLVKLREESSELMHKIELFTTERREVLEKMETLQAENHQHLETIKQLQEDKNQLEYNYDKLKSELQNNEKLLVEADIERKELLSNIDEIGQQRSQLQEEYNNLVKETNAQIMEESVQGVDMAASTTQSIISATSPIDKIVYEKSIETLEIEMENFRKTKDKNSKLTISKKIAKEAKNCQTLLKNLMEKYEANTQELEQLKLKMANEQVTAASIAEVEHFKSVDSEVGALQTKCILLESELTDCRAKLKDYQIHETELKHQITDMMRKLANKDELLKEHESDTTKLLAEIKTLQDSIQDGRDERSIELNNCIASQLSEITELKTVVDKLNENIKSQDDNLNKKEKELVHVRTELQSQIEATLQQMEILKTLVAEQKQQLIDQLLEHENETTESLEKIEKYEDQLRRKSEEIEILKQNNDISNDNVNEIEVLRKLMIENNEILIQQTEELKNKQETIDALNQQIIDLYGTMAENSSKIIDKEDEISHLQELLDANRDEIRMLNEKCCQNNKTVETLQLKLVEVEQKNARSANATDDVKIGLEKRIQELENKVADLDAKNKEQLDKMKKFAANLKKKVAQCAELEEKLSKIEATDTKMLENKSIDMLKQLDQKTNEVIQLQQKLTSAEEQLHLLQRESNKKMIDLQQSSESRNNELTVLKEKVAVLEDLVKSKDTQLNNQQQEYTLIRDELFSKSSEVDTLMSAKCEFEAELNKLQHEFDKLNKELSNEQEDLRNKNIKIEKCKAIIKEKNKEIHRLNDTNKELSEKNQHLSETNQESLSASIKLERNKSEEELNYTKQKYEDDIRNLKQANDETIEKLAEELNIKKQNYDVEINRLMRLQVEGEKAEENLKREIETERKKFTEDFLQVQQNYEEEIKTLRQINADLELNSKTSCEGYQAKLEENSLYIETIDNENSQLKDKISKLEEGIALIEERRNSLEQQTNILGAQLREKTNEFTQNEDMLVQRLETLSQHDEIIVKKLQEVQQDKQDLNDQIKELITEREEMARRVINLENQLHELKEGEVNGLERENNALTQQLQAQQAEIKRLHDDFEKKMHEKNNEIDDLEVDLSHQLQKIENERKALQETLEKIRDENSELQDEIMRLKESVHCLEQIKNDLERDMTWTKMQNDNLVQDQFEVQELRMQIVQDQTEIENLKQQNESINVTHNQEVRDLQQTIEELKTTINQNANMPNLQLENEKLLNLLAEKDKEIANYQQRTLQLQMASFAPPTQEHINDPFSAFTIPPSTPAQSNQMQNEIIELKDKINVLNLQLVAENEEGKRLKEQYLELNKGYHDQEAQINELKKTENELSYLNERSIAQLNEEKDNEIRTLKIELNKMKENFVQKQLQGEIQSAQMQQDIQNPIHNINFEELVLVKNVSSLQGSQSSKQQKPDHDSEEIIANLQQQLSSLQNYVADLELQFRNLTQSHSETMQELGKKTDQLDKLTIDFNASLEKINDLENINKNLNQQQKKQSDEPKPEKLIAQVTPVVSGNTSNIPSFAGSLFFDPNSSAGFFDQPTLPHPNNLDFHFSSPEQHQQEEQQDEYENRVPVVEEIIVPKKAYICHPVQQDSIPSSVVPEVELPTGDEGWGWGEDDAILEEQHHQKASAPIMSLLPPSAEIEIKYQVYEDKIQELELERDRLREEIVALQVKSGKMLKKLKEYKSKNDALSTRNFRKSVSVESSDLDLAIQEELNNQVKILEIKLKETQSDHEKDTAEKENLLKRIDVLTAANERMTEMKERQDIDMEMCRSKIKQLTGQLQKLEDWGDEGYNNSQLPKEVKESTTTEPPVSSDGNVQSLMEQITELNAHINDLRVDNEEFQAMLEEERANCKIAEVRIEQLQAQIATFGETTDDEHKKIRQLESEKDVLRKEITSRDAEIQELRTRVRTLEDEVRESIHLIDQLSSESENIKKSLDQLSNDRKQKIDENITLGNQLKDLAEKNAELAALMQTSQFHSNQQQSEVDDKIIQEYEEKIQDLVATLQYKDSEIVHLNQKIKDVIQEDQTQSLVQEIFQKNHEINKLKESVQELENDKTELQNNLSIQLTQALKAKGEDDQALETEELNKIILNLEKLVESLKQEKESMEHELQVLNEQVLNSLAFEDKMKGTVLELDMKNIEISELKNSIEQMRTSSSNGAAANDDALRDELRRLQMEKVELENTFKTTIEQLNLQYSALIEQRGIDVAESWKEHLASRESQFAELEQSLQDQLEQLKLRLAENVDQSQIPEIDRSEKELKNIDTEMVIKMQEALENQELEIVTLKEQLAIRSAEYAALSAQLDPFGHTATSNMASVQPKLIKTPAKKQSHSDISGHQPETNKSGGANVPRTELDLALYMLHQRDMRCEELTQELFNLLEERDTLQLKLSNAIRQIEENKKKMGGPPRVTKTTTIAATDVPTSSDAESSDANPSKTNTPEKSANADLNRESTEKTETAEDVRHSFPDLYAKLSELSAVSHTRDKYLREEREQRHRQMALLQKDLANIPPEALSDLVGADHTLSRTSQSPSSVLLNWLWGNSTPKAPPPS